MKNILIITNTRDNLGSTISFIKNIEDIKDLRIKEMIVACINGTSYEFEDLWTSNHMCGSDRGYIFNESTLFDSNLPIKIEHIVNYVF